MKYSSTKVSNFENPSVVKKGQKYDSLPKNAFVIEMLLFSLKKIWFSNEKGVNLKTQNFESHY